MSVLILVLVIFPLSDKAFPESLDMGRPKLEKQTTSAEIMKKWIQNLNKELENKEKMAKYHQNKGTKSTEQLEKGKKLESVKLYQKKNKNKHLSHQKL